MRAAYPEALNFPALDPPRADKNLVEVRNLVKPDDVFYMISELERKLGVDNSTDAASIDYRIRRLEARVNEVINLTLPGDPGYRSGHHTIAAAGRQTIPIPRSMRTINYMVHCYIIDANRNPLQAVPFYDASQLVNSFDADCADAGELYYSLIPNDPT
jgi:hypothetical protein